MKIRSESLIHGTIASLLLFLIYFGIVGYAESISHAIGTFLSISYLMVPLIASFGVQVALYSYSRQYSRMMRNNSKGTTAYGALSAGSMIACCAHHVTDIIPIIGITAVGSMLVAFQPLFIMIGLLSNIVGILTILGIIQKYNLYDSSGMLARIMHININRARNYAIVFSTIMVVGIALASVTSQANLSPLYTSETDTVFSLPEKTLQQRGLEIRVSPIPFSFGQEVNFKISFDTHSGGLDFDMVKATSLEDDHGNRYAAIEWSGSPPGGHHREGTISFSSLSGKPHSIKLVIRDIYGVDSWVYDWKLEVK